MALWGQKKIIENEKAMAFDPLSILALIEAAGLNYHLGRALEILVYASQSKHLDKDLDDAKALISRHQEITPEQTSTYPRVRSTSMTDTGVDVKP